MRLLNSFLCLKVASFQYSDTWSDYTVWGFDKRSEDFNHGDLDDQEYDGKDDFDAENLEDDIYERNDNVFVYKRKLGSM